MSDLMGQNEALEALRGHNLKKKGERAFPLRCIHCCTRQGAKILSFFYMPRSVTPPPTPPKSESLARQEKMID